MKCYKSQGRKGLIDWGVHGGETKVRENDDYTTYYTCFFLSYLLT